MDSNVSIASSCSDHSPSHPVSERSLIESEIEQLELRLREAKARIKALDRISTGAIDHLSLQSTYSDSSSLHGLLLLSDSALPLGSFAFSSGLESYFAHCSKRDHSVPKFKHFLSLSLASLAGFALPYLITAYKEASRLSELDNDIDASTTCSVARRASVQQGRALITIWDRSFSGNFLRPSSSSDQDSSRAAHELDKFASKLKSSSSANDAFPPNGHLAPLFGTVCAALSLSLQDAVFVFLFNQAKSSVSAAVRTNLIGPYLAQSILASQQLRHRISSLVSNAMKRPHLDTKDAGQSVPMLDIWTGRHEVIYSRLFNS